MTMLQVNDLIKRTQALEQEYGGIAVNLNSMTAMQIQQYYYFLEYSNNL